MSNTDKPWITKEIKKLDRWKKVEYKRHGKSEKYQEILKKYDDKMLIASKQHLRRNVTDLMEAAPGRAWATLKRMGAQPGECGEEGSFTLTDHLEQNLTLEESLEKIVTYFSAISCQHPPLDTELLPERVKFKLLTPNNPADIPNISAYDVWQIQQGRHKTQSCVPGDIPPRLRHEFQVELSEPAALIFNNISSSGQWCQDWLEEFGTPLKKTQSPANEKSLRIIAITHSFSLTYERFVLKWLLYYVEDKLDPDQFGGRKGHAVAHYLIEVQNAILHNQDLEKPFATLFTAIDIEKGFNKIEHNELITRISDMGCPNWLLKIVVSYLKGRTLKIRWQGKMSRELPLNSGTGQGTILGLFFFCITFNGAGPKQTTEPLGITITQTRKRRKPIKTGKKKWVDDLSLTVPIRLSDNLVPENRPREIGPVQFHNRTGQMLPRNKNQMQNELDNLNEYCRMSKMSINQEKSKCIIFNRSKKNDVMPELYLTPSSKLEVVEQMKLVGYQIRSDLRTISNTQYIVKRAWKKMWIVRRLKALGASETEMLTVLRAQVLSVLHFASPAWSTQISSRESSQIESVLRTGLYLVYGHRYLSFSWALREAKMTTLKEQRSKMFTKFTKDCLKNPKFQTWFVRTDSSEVVNTRRQKPVFKPIPTRTRIYERSAIPQMVRVANSIKPPAPNTTKIISNSGLVILI